MNADAGRRTTPCPTTRMTFAGYAARSVHVRICGLCTRASVNVAGSGDGVSAGTAGSGSRPTKGRRDKNNFTSMLDGWRCSGVSGGCINREGINRMCDLIDFWEPCERCGELIHLCNKSGRPHKRVFCKGCKPKTWRDVPLSFIHYEPEPQTFDEVWLIDSGYEKVDLYR